MISKGEDAYIPEEYIAQEELRLELYRRLASVMGEDDLAALHNDTRDRFGKLPETVEELFVLARLRYRARLAGIRSLEFISGPKQALRIKFIQPKFYRMEKHLKGFMKYILRASDRDVEFSLPKGKKAVDFAKKLLTILVR